jgi:hypothetical protein
MELLEDWVEMDTSVEYCMEFTNAVLVIFIYLCDELKFLEKKIAYKKVHIQHEKLDLNESLVTLMQGEDMQQPIDINYKFQQVCTNMYQSLDRPNMEIDELWMLMMRVHKRRHNKVIRTNTNKVQMIVIL